MRHTLKKVTIALLGFLSFFSAENLWGQSNADLNPEQVQAFNNYHHEIVECVIFYNISIDGMKRRAGSEETVAIYQSISDTLLKRAMVVSDIIGMKDETIAARLQMAATAQLEEIDQNFVNISILMEKYLTSCKAVFVDPESRILFWYGKTVDAPPS